MCSSGTQLCGVVSRPHPPFNLTGGTTKGQWKRYQRLPPRKMFQADKCRDIHAFIVATDNIVLSQKPEQTQKTRWSESAMIILEQPLRTFAERCVFLVLLIIPKMIWFLIQVLLLISISKTKQDLYINHRALPCKAKPELHAKVTGSHMIKVFLEFVASGRRENWSARAVFPPKRTEFPRSCQQTTELSGSGRQVWKRQPSLHTCKKQNNYT